MTSQPETELTKVIVTDKAARWIAMAAFLNVPAVQDFIAKHLKETPENGRNNPRPKPRKRGK